MDPAVRGGSVSPSITIELLRRRKGRSEHFKPTRCWPSWRT